MLAKIDDRTPEVRWAQMTRRCKVELAIKKIAITIIGLLNFGALGTAAYFAMRLMPLPTDALVVSPFVAGILGALVYMKLPTCGVNSTNYMQYSNPSTIVGKGLAYLFFGPLMLAVRVVDWTPYYDIKTARDITIELRGEVSSPPVLEEPIEVGLADPVPSPGEPLLGVDPSLTVGESPKKACSFEEIAEKWGYRFKNLGRYGFITTPNAYKDYKELLYRHKNLKPFLEQFKDGKLSPQRQEQKDAIETDWQRLRDAFQEALPLPAWPVVHTPGLASRIGKTIRNAWMNYPVNVMTTPTTTKKPADD